MANMKRLREDRDDEDAVERWSEKLDCLV